MSAARPDHLLLVAARTELPPTQRVWGTGGWLAPEQREALDWLTLARLLGWGVTVAHCAGSALDSEVPERPRCIVLACDPASLGATLVAQLASWLAAAPLLVVARADTDGSPLARLAGVARRPESVTGRALTWSGPGPQRMWRCRTALAASAMALAVGTSLWSALDGTPLIAARRVGRGIIATLGFHPSQARDTAGYATALLRHLLIYGAATPVAWLDLADTLVLRMDDPGGAQNVHSRGWSYPKLGEAAWDAISTDLRRRAARLSVCYVSGWVDDGDVERGTLKVAGRCLPRVPGAVYPSPLVQYHDRAGHAPGTRHDYAAEFRGIQALRRAGLGDVELHGYTHMHPDTEAWARAPDRYETAPATAWYRELGEAARATIAARPPEHHPLALGIAACKQLFDVHPTTLICPGDQWTPDIPERALDLGLQLVSSYYLALRYEQRFCWTQHVCAPYLDQPEAAWFDAGLPVVGYFHDYDLARAGVSWMGQWLDRWQDAGARTLIDLRVLAAATGCRLHLAADGAALSLTVTSQNAPALVRPLPIALYVPGRQLPTQVVVSLSEGTLTLPVAASGEGCGHVCLPPGLPYTPSC